jgi:hypothetical protein
MLFMLVFIPFIPFMFIPFMWLCRWFTMPPMVLHFLMFYKVAGNTTVWWTNIFPFQDWHTTRHKAIRIKAYLVI